MHLRKTGHYYVLFTKEGLVSCEHTALIGEFFAAPAGKDEAEHRRVNRAAFVLKLYARWVITR